MNEEQLAAIREHVEATGTHPCVLRQDAEALLREVERLGAAIDAIWEAGDLNDEQIDAYRSVRPYEGIDILPLFESDGASG